MNICECVLGHCCSTHGGRGKHSTTVYTAWHASAWRLHGPEVSSRYNPSHHHKAAPQVYTFWTGPPYRWKYTTIASGVEVAIENANQLALPVLTLWETCSTTFVSNWLSEHKATITDTWSRGRPAYHVSRHRWLQDERKLKISLSPHVSHRDSIDEK